MKHDVVAELAVTANDRAAMHLAAGAEDAPLANDRKREQAAVLANAGSRVNACQWVNAMAWRLCTAMQTADNNDEGRERIGDLDQSLAVDGDGGWGDDRRGPAVVQIAGVFFVFDESDIALLGFVQRAGRDNFAVTVADNLP
jgi:hypothetical protein